MRVIVETNSRVRVRTRTRVKRAVVRLLRFLAGAPDTTSGEAIVVRRVSRVGAVVRAERGVETACDAIEDVLCGR